MPASRGTARGDDGAVGSASEQNGMTTSRASTPVRSACERLWQTLGYELLGLALVTPLVSLTTGASLHRALNLLMLLSLVVMAWTALYNTVFDILEARGFGRVASARPVRWRMLHAVGLEVTALAVSLPVIVAVTALNWSDALQLDLALTVIYACWGYAYHWAYDRLRPVGSSPS